LQLGAIAWHSRHELLATLLLAQLHMIIGYMSNSNVLLLAQNTFQIGGDGVASTVTQQSSSAQGIAAAPGLTVLAPGGAPTISANPALVRS